ncbi:hypothetical protein TWF694_008444 [Orbilia ellipsospora]|uniref:F-box domain-containing protein n=1 Tax=Orbilia ellipsospora TaxID=2528407 RepID=A0AAV9XG64_9PEZI
MLKATGIYGQITSYLATRGWISATPETPTGLFSLPNELLDHILSFLSVDDLKELSLCSTKYRNLILPVLFRSLIWRRVSDIMEFQNGAKFAYLRPMVRHITICVDEKITVQTVSVNIVACRHLAPAILLFPNITSLAIKANTIEHLEGNLITAILTTISASPIFENIRFFNLQRAYPELNFRRQLEEHVVCNAWDSLSPANQEFLKPWVPEEMYGRIVAFPYPPNLTEACLHVNWFTLVAPDPDASVPDSTRTIHGDCKKTLKKLRIAVNGFLISREKQLLGEARTVGEPFLKVTMLQVDCESFDEMMIPDIAASFPVLERLAIIDVKRTRSQRTEAVLMVAFNGLKQMERLREVRVPWPQYTVGYGWDHVDEAYLEIWGREWVSQEPEFLRRVIFTRNEDRHRWDDVAKKRVSNYVDGMFGFDVVREQKGWYIEVRREFTRRLDAGKEGPFRFEESKFADLFRWEASEIYLRGLLPMDYSAWGF